MYAAGVSLRSRAVMEYHRRVRFSLFYCMYPHTLFILLIPATARFCHFLSHLCFLFLLIFLLLNNVNYLYYILSIIYYILTVLVIFALHACFRYQLYGLHAVCLHTSTFPAAFPSPLSFSLALEPQLACILCSFFFILD